MRIQTLLAGLLAFTIALPIARTASAASQDEEHEETPLAAAMTEIADGLRILRRSVRDPEALEDSLAAVASCQKASHLCKSHAPAMAANLPEAERPAFIKAYRLEMIVLERGLLDLEEALLVGKDEDTLRALYKALKELEDPAHERFTEGG